MKILLAPFALIAIAACTQGDAAAEAATLTAGNVERGRVAIRELGCGTCHAIPGVAGARGLVGPSLERMASRSYIAGVVGNSPENMVRWIMNPPAVNPLTAMPDLAIAEETARDIAAYLYTLR